jgi:hypothetical protein
VCCHRQLTSFNIIDTYFCPREPLVGSKEG